MHHHAKDLSQALEQLDEYSSDGATAPSPKILFACHRSDQSTPLVNFSTASTVSPCLSVGIGNVPNLNSTHCQACPRDLFIPVFIWSILWLILGAFSVVLSPVFKVLLGDIYYKGSFSTIIHPTELYKS